MQPTAILLGSLAAMAAFAQHAAFAQTDAAAARAPNSSRIPTIARTTTVPACAIHVDRAAGAGGDGSAARPLATIAEAISAAKPGAVICIAEGTYAESLSPGTKPFTLAGGFERGKAFAVRDSAAFVSLAKGTGGSFVRFDGAGPGADNLIAIDGFEITGYAQAIYGDFTGPQRLDLTNNFIHDNRCNDPSLAGAGFALNNVSGNIRGNVIRSNVCGRGGAGFINDAANKNTMVIESNLIDGNAGIEPTSALGGALYLFVNRVAIRDNLFSGNTVTQQGAGLYLGAFTAGGQQTSASLARNIYRANRAGVAGGGLFCDDGAACLSSDEVFERNCGGNILLGSGPAGSGPTIAKFDRMTNADALDPGCTAPGTGVSIEKSNDAPDSYSFTNSTFRANAKGRDFATACTSGCSAAKVSVTGSAVQTDYQDGSIKIAFEAVVASPAAIAAVPAPPPPPPPAVAPIPPQSAAADRCSRGERAAGRGRGGADSAATGCDRTRCSRGERAAGRGRGCTLSATPRSPAAESRARGQTRPARGRSGARRQLHELSRALQSLLHGPGLDTFQDHFRQPRRQRQRNVARAADAAGSRSEGGEARYHDPLPARHLRRLLRVRCGEQRHLRRAGRAVR